MKKETTENNEKNKQEILTANLLEWYVYELNKYNVHTVCSLNIVFLP